MKEQDFDEHFHRMIGFLGERTFEIYGQHLADNKYRFEGVNDEQAIFARGNHQVVLLPGDKWRLEWDGKELDGEGIKKLAELTALSPRN
jgi:hypothetical protein